MRIDRVQHQKVLDWARDRDYMVLACIPLGSEPGYLPRYAMLIERPAERCHGIKYVCWTACIEENGEVSACWGHYGASMGDALKSLQYKLDMITRENLEQTA